MRLLHRALTFVLLIAATGRAEPYDWPQWQGPDRDCFTKEKGLLKTWPEGGPKLRWLFDKCGLGYSGPAIVDGRLFIMGARDGEEKLLALDASNGQELWAAPISPEYQNNWGDGPRGTPTIDGWRAFALSANGTLICVDVKDGHEIWRTTMESLGGQIPKWGFTESVLIDGNKLLCTPGGSKGAIVALDKATGKVIWQATELTDFAHYSSIVRGEFHRQPQYVQLLEKRLVGLSPEDGKLLWEVPWPGSVAVVPTPIIFDDRIFVTSGYGAGCMLVEINDDNEAKQVYANKLMKNHHGGVIRIGKYVYGYSDQVGWLCMDLATGNSKWKERDALGKGAIGYADGRFYCIDEKENDEKKGTVMLIEASPKGWTVRGELKLSPLSKQRKPSGGIWVHPVIVDGKLYLRDQEYLYCFDVKK